MSQIATAASFTDGTLYSDYHRFSCFAQRADYITRAYPDARTVLVAGCAWGFLVDELCKFGIDAWGVDASAWAIEQASITVSPDTFRFIWHGDCTDARAMARFGVFDLVVTEDLLPMADDTAEAQRMLAALRPIGRDVLHIVSCDYPGATHTAPLLWRSLAGWQALCAPDAVISADDVRIV